MSKHHNTTGHARRTVVGLTGNIACGKSTVSRMLAGLGAAVADADEIAHEALEPGTETFREVVTAFGEHVVDPSGQIDRRALGGIVFSDPCALRRLESIVHPYVRERVLRFVRARNGIVVIDAIKLLESPLAGICDVVWVVTCPEEAQISRLAERNGFSRQEALRRIRSQGPQSEKAAMADTVIVNDGDRESLREQVLRAWTALAQRA